MSIFNKMVLKKPSRSRHNLSYSSKFSTDFGRLIPIYCEKVVPSDTFKHSQEFYLRFAPFVNQVFQEFIVQTDYYFVPSRLLWKKFEDFISDPSSEIIHPFVNYMRYFNMNFPDYKNVLLETSVFDYFNLPTDKSNKQYVWPADKVAEYQSKYYIDILPFLAYLRIFLEYYADENLAFEEWINNKDFGLYSFNGTGDNTLFLEGLFRQFHEKIGDFHYSNDIGLFMPLTKMYGKDYFGSALPRAQFGAAVQIPLDASGTIVITRPDGTTQKYQNVGMTYNSANNEVTLLGSGSNTVPDANSEPLTFHIEKVNNVATVTDLRNAVQIAQFLEKRGYAGHRYKEVVKSSFGFDTKDARLDRPELLQRNRNVVQLGDVFTTSFDNEDSVPGMAVSTAKSANSSPAWKRTFDEHGYVIGLMCIYPKPAYYQGIPKQFNELDVFDYYWPEFQHIGEQEINKTELLASSFNPSTFGYTPRYAQYKQRQNQIHGNFRSSLESMHAGRKFTSGSDIILNDSFLSINPDRNDLYRVFNAKYSKSGSQPVYVDLFHKVKSLRPMSYYGLPKFI